MSVKEVIKFVFIATGSQRVMGAKEGCEFFLALWGGGADYCLPRVTDFSCGIDIHNATKGRVQE